MRRRMAAREETAMPEPTLLPGRAAALLGLAFAVLLFFGLAIVDPPRDATNDELVQWWSDSANQRDSALSMYFKLGAAACFLGFAAYVAQRLRTFMPGSGLPRLVAALALLFAAMLCVSAVVRGAIGQSVHFEDEALPGVDALRLAEQVTSVALGMFAMGSVAAMLAVASFAIVRTGAFASWVGWAGIAVAAITVVMVVLLAGAWASPFVQLWVVAASVACWRQDRRPASVPEAEHGAAVPAA